MLKENWDTASNLTITYEKVINFDDLLSMHKVSDVSVLISSSIKVASSCLTIWASRDENIRYFGALNKNLKTIDVALYNRKTPLFFNFIFVKFNKEAFIPSKPVFNSHLLMLEGLSEVVLVRKIEAISEDFIKLSDFFKNLFFLRL